MIPALRQALLEQYGAHKSWSAQLHHDNLVALAETRPELRPVPSYTTLRRFLAASGLTRRPATTPRQTDGTLAAAARLEAREVRGFEAEYVNGLWHWDCHHGSRKVLTSRGEWRTPILFGVLDDRSRLACHLQWYLALRLAFTRTERRTLRKSDGTAASILWFTRRLLRPWGGRRAAVRSQPVGRSFSPGAVRCRAAAA